MLKVAYSPCPNDTFVFHAWHHGLIEGAPEIHVTYADIDQTNYFATADSMYDVLKISYAALPWVLDDYALIPCGGALGEGCGPLLLTKSDEDMAKLKQATIAVPSDRSTAYLLFRIWAEERFPGGIGNIIVMPFDEIMPALQQGKIQAGLVIHEARFTYPSYGLHKLVDLGEWWEQTTQSPIPLGAIIAKRTLPLQSIEQAIRASVQYAWKHPERSQAYVLEHAQEMDPVVAQAHIDLYVNRFTENLGDTGYKAVELLLTRAAKIHLVPAFDSQFIRKL